MPFKPIQKLIVTRTLSSGEQVAVGVLAQNRQGVFFQYAESYVQQFGNLSPFTLLASTQVQAAPKQPHQGVHGVFGDCLPDGWGLLLQDRIFRQKGILPNQLTAMDRLAFVGSKGMGALSFAPVSEFSASTYAEIDLAALGLEAQALFDSSMSDYSDSNQDDLDGQTQQVLAALVAGGSSGGARPKAQIYMPAGETKQCRTIAQPGDEAWLIKLTSKHLALGHEEGLCEAAFLQTDDGKWQPAPFYDVTYSPHPFNEHATAFGGYGKVPPIKVMQKLATTAGFANWRAARQVIEEVAEALSQFSYLAQQQGISKTTVAAITKTLNQRKQENAALFLQQ